MSAGQISPFIAIAHLLKDRPLNATLEGYFTSTGIP